MNKIAVFNIYYGEVPSYFNYWLLSASYNPTIDFYIVTDNRSLLSANNVHYIYMTFSDLKACFQKCVNFRICLDTPYKICDYKVAIGDAFSDIISAYDWWGFCDLDMIFGNIRHFITEEILNNSQVIYKKGHLMLFKNTAEIRSLYKRSPGLKGISYKLGFRSALSSFMDEHMGMEKIAKRYNVRSYYDTKNDIVDIIPDSFPMMTFNTWEQGVALWDKGKLFWLSAGNQTEKIYIHLQKRKIECEDSVPGDKFYILADRICPHLPEQVDTEEPEVIIQKPLSTSWKKIRRTLFWDLIVSIKRKVYWL